MPLSLLPPIAHLGVTKSTWTLSTKLCLLYAMFSNMPVWIYGDMDLPDIGWETEQLTTNRYMHSIRYSFFGSLRYIGLHEIVNFPTRSNNTLDVVLTNRPSLVKQCDGITSMCDHNIVFVEKSSHSFCHKRVRCKIFLRKHANVDNMCLPISNWNRDFITYDTTFTPVERHATIITDSLYKIVSDNVPSQFLTKRLEQCRTIMKLCKNVNMKIFLFFYDCWLL